MFTMTITLPVYVVCFLLMGSAGIGYAVRATQRLRMRKTIEDLESASISNNSRILELERELLSLESKLKEWQIPVIPLKKGTIAQNPQAISPKSNVPDMSLRKQLLRKNDENRHSASR